MKKSGFKILLGNGLITSTSIVKGWFLTVGFVGFFYFQALRVIFYTEVFAVNYIGS